MVEVLQKASGIFLIPIYTAYMDPEQFGILSTCLSFSAMVPYLLFLGIFEAAYFAVIKKEANAENNISTVFLFELFVAMIIITLASVILYFLPAGFTLFKISFYPYIFFTIIMSALSVFPITMNQIFLASERLRAYVGLSIISFIISTSLILVLLIKYELGSMSFILGNSVMSSIILIIVAVCFSPLKGLHSRGSDLRGMLRFTAPLVPHNMAHLARTYSDRILLTSFVSPASTGLFQIATSYGSILLLGVEAFRNANNPRFFSLIEKSEEQQSLTAMLPLSLGFFSFAALGLGLFSQDILTLLTSRNFHGAYHYIPFVLSANLFFLIYLNLVNVLFNAGRTKLIATVTFVSSIASVSAGAILISRLSITGAALSMVFSNLLMTSLIFYQCQKTMKLPWPFFRASLLALFPLALLAIDLQSIYSKALFLAGAGVFIVQLVKKDAKKVGLL